MTYKLYLDDYRESPKDHILVKSYDEFCAYIQNNGLPEFVSFDHDLADVHYNKEIDYGDKTSEKTGYHCALWLMKYCTDNGLNFPQNKVHSMNPVGAERIKYVIYCYEKHGKLPEYIDELLS